MGFFKDIRDVSKQGKELGDYHGGMPTWKQAMSDFRGVADDRGQGEVLSKGTPSSAVVKGPPMPIEGDRFAMQILLDVTPPGGGSAYEVNYVFPAARMKAGLMPGQTVPIKVMPGDPQRVAVHWDAQKANIAAAGGDMAAAMQGMQNIYAGTPDVGGRARPGGLRRRRRLGRRVLGRAPAHVLGQRAERRGDLRAERRVGDEPVRPDGVAGDRDARAGLLDDVGADVAEHLAQRVVGVGAARGGGNARGVDEGHGPAVHLGPADRPVEQVLERARQRAGVLRRAEQHGVAGADGRPEPRDRGVERV